MDRGELSNTLKRLCKVMWEANVSNPITYVTQISYLLFLKMLEEIDTEQKGLARFADHTLQDAIRTNLAQQGFWAAFGHGTGSWVGNSIPYREDAAADKTAVMDYLKRKWLGRGWINVSDPLRNAIVGHVWETYENAFEHAQSPIGVFSCGQHFPRNKELNLTLVDFGLGIPSNVRWFLDRSDISAASALKWAFQPGTSIKQNGIGRGMGLALVKDFVRKNHGKLEVFSHDGYARIDEKGEDYRTMPNSFEGTLVNIGLVCDDSRYCLASELVDEPLF